MDPMCYPQRPGKQPEVYKPVEQPRQRVGQAEARAAYQAALGSAYDCRANAGLP